MFVIMTDATQKSDGHTGLPLIMKHKTKTKNLEDSTQNDGSGQTDPTQPGEGVRRSTRKRSAPKTFVVPTKKSKALYWTTAEKERLLKILQEVNTQQHAASLYCCDNRFPIKLIRNRIGNKSLSEVRKYLTLLERRAAGMALNQMKHQAPLQSWRQMADKLTVLTSDNCSRQLIRVCNIMALESAVQENGDGEIQNISTSSVTPATTTSPAVNSTCGNLTTNPSTLNEFTSPDALDSANDIAMMNSSNKQTLLEISTPDNISSTAEPSQSISQTVATAAMINNVSATATATARDISGGKSSSAAPTAATTVRSSPSASAMTSTRHISSAITTPPPTPAAAATTTADSSSASAEVQTLTRDSISAEATRDDSSPSSSEPNKSPELQLKPDFPAIYTYIANLMQGEQQRLGPLEALVVLDCLKTVEKHLVARENTKQKMFAQKRFLDILENLYVSEDGETAKTSGGGDMDEDTDAGNVVTMTDLMGITNQSQSEKCQADQSQDTLPETSQSASGPSNGQSTSSPSQDQSSSATKKSSKEHSRRLGSLNPFGVPVKLLEIRKGR